MTNPSGIHYRPKAKKNLRAKLLRHRKHLRGLLSQAQREPSFEAQQQLQAGMQHLAQSLPSQYREQLKERTTLEAKQQATWLLTCFRAEIQKLDDTHHRLDE
jgi:membrane carboxypeptidase/penicillin-binding protein PbpC